MSGILVYALHHEGAFNKNSLGAVSEGARVASELGKECHAIVVGEGISDDLAGQLGNYGATKVFRAEGPEGLAQPVVDAMAKVIADNGYEHGRHGHAFQFIDPLHSFLNLKSADCEAERCDLESGLTDR